MDRISRLRKLLRDPARWIEIFLKVRTREGMLVPFRLNKFQLRLVAAVVEALETRGRAFFVILKGRQLGISTICRGLMRWRALNFPGQQCVIATHEEGLVRQSMSLMVDMLDSMPANLLPYPKPDVLSESRILWRRSGSAILSRLPAGKSEGRGLPVNFLHCTEVDFFDSVSSGCWERFLGGVLPAIPRTGSIFIVESTCQGRKALYDLYLKSLAPGSEWRHLFFPWYEEDSYRSPISQESGDGERER